MIYLLVNFIFLFLSLLDFKRKKIIIYIGVLIFIFFSALRYQTGLDWLMYKSYYELTYEEIIKKGNTDIGYNWFMQIFKKMKFSYYGMQFVISIFTATVIYRFYKKYSEYPMFCLLLYFNMYYLRYNMGLQKQMLALTFCLLAFERISENKKKIGVVLYILAILFHFSSLIFFPIFFLRNRTMNLKLLIYIMTFIIIVVGIFKINITESLLKMLLEIFKHFNLNYYSKKILDYLYDEYYARKAVMGKNLIIRIFIVYLIYFFRKPKSKREKFLYTMGIIYVISSCISLNMHILDRFEIYFGVFSIIYFSYFIEIVAKKKQRVILMLLLGLYFSQGTITLVYFQKNTRHYMRFIPYYNILTKEKSEIRKRAELGEIGE